MTDLGRGQGQRGLYWYATASPVALQETSVIYEIGLKGQIVTKDGLSGLTEWPHL